MSNSKFLITAEESELLLLFEELEDVVAISEKIGKDQSGVSRAIKRLAEKVPVLEKRFGRWRITELGAELNTINRNMLQAHHALFKSQQRLRIGSNREFVTRILAPRIQELSAMLGDSRIDLLSFESGIEQALKAGQIDFGFDCGRPVDPVISYKMTTPEPIAPFCSRAFLKRNRTQVEQEDWSKLSHILCERLYPDRVMNLSQREWNVAAHVNDIGTARELCVQSSGWALLPCYAVQREVKNGDLIMMGKTIYSDEKYGVWWLRERKYMAPTIKNISEWIMGISLSV